MMVKKGESLTPEHKAAIGRGIRANRAARDEMARRANEASLVQRLKQQAPRVLHAHRADQECNQDCTTSGRGGTSPCECREGHQCIWCQYQKGKDTVSKAAQREVLKDIAALRDSLPPCTDENVGFRYDLRKILENHGYDGKVDQD